MPNHDTTLEQIEYRLVLLRAGSRTIWALHENGAFRLPRIAIAHWARPAEQIQQAVEAGWHIRAVVLDLLPSESGSTPCAVVEILSPEPYDGLFTASIHPDLEMELAREERGEVETILAGETTLRGPFSCLGWIDEALEWMRKVVGPDARFTGEVRQYNATSNFTLAHFPTQDRAGFWLKATGEPNLHEFPITKLLAELCPEFLPPRIAERSDWNAWLMEDAGCPPEAWSLPLLELAVASMAELQKRTIARTDDFLAAGAFDQHVCRLRAHSSTLVEYLDEAMTRQVSPKAPRIDKCRLQQTATMVANASVQMEGLAIPDTIVHHDLNSGNILFRGARCVFTDWCEAGIGNPFLTLEHLLHLQPHGEKDWAPRLQEVYKQCWLECLTSSQIDRALELMPILAISAYLHWYRLRLSSAQHNDPCIAGYIRCLARHMDRAAQDPRLLEALCR